MFSFKNKISYKPWVLRILGTVLLFLILNSIFLYITDTYSIANSNPKKFFSIPNQKYLITNYILNHKKDYDTFIFGSSRVGAINPLIMKDKKAYNMTYGEGIPHEHLLLIKLFIKNNINIKHLLIGLDDFSYEVSFQSHQQSYVPKSHYLATDESIIDFYKFYFFHRPRGNDTKHFKRKFLNGPYPEELYDDVYKTIFEQKKIFSNSKTMYIVKKESNSTKYTVKISNFKKNKKHIIDFNNALNDIKEIVKLAKENNINLKIFINPLKNTTYNSIINKDLLNEFKNKLSYITSFYDFSTSNHINNDDNNWPDISHYNRYVGDMILNRIYDNNTSIKDFGIYIEKKEKNKNAI